MEFIPGKQRKYLDTTLYSYLDDENRIKEATLDQMRVVALRDAETTQKFMDFLGGEK
jgi:hypothetical protein